MTSVPSDNLARVRIGQVGVLMVGVASKAARDESDIDWSNARAGIRIVEGVAP